MLDRPNTAYPIREDMDFQRRDWLAERIGWAAVAVIVAVALTGLLASGPLSRATAVAPSHQLSVDYERFQRVTVATHFTFHVASATGPVELKLGPAFTSDFQIDSLQPAPLRDTQGPDGLRLTFAPPSNGGEFTMVMWCRPRHFGLVDLTVGLGAQASIRRVILIYP